MKTINKLGLILITMLCFSFGSALAQIDTNYKLINISFQEFLNLVSKNNIQFASEKYNVSIAEANIEVAKVFPNPSLSIEWAENREESKRSGYGFTAELATSIELGGKRAARIELAKSSHELAKIQLNDYFRNLRSEASTAYLEAIKLDKIFKVKQNSYDKMRQIAQADSIRFALGSITETDAIQSKLEADVLFNELMQAKTEWIHSFNQMILMIGINLKDSIYYPIGNLVFQPRDFDVDSLIQIAKINRADILAIKQNKKVSENELTLSEKMRIMDLEFKIGFGNSYAVPGVTPTATELKASIAIPLQLSNIYSGETDIAKFKVSQMELLYQQANIQLESEIYQAYNQYITYKRQTDNYQGGLLNRSKTVLDGKIYSYNRGETSLLEVLNAQRTYNEIQISYYESLFNYAVSLVALEKTSGIWDVNF